MGKNTQLIKYYPYLYSVIKKQPIKTGGNSINSA